MADEDGETLVFFVNGKKVSQMRCCSETSFISGQLTTFGFLFCNARFKFP